MATNEDSVGVPKCYPFKSRLQEYAQKRALKVPVYETTKEGPSHEPFFRSTVIVNDVRYDSLLGFGTRKEAEQSAAEIALVEISKLGDGNQLSAHPIHESGLCKNLLQEFAQKMNYARPSYECQADHSSKGQPMYSCTLDLGGTRYVGSMAKTKKEAEIKVARTALLAIQSTNPDSPIGSLGKTQLTVLPSKKRQSESNACSDEKAKNTKRRRPKPRRKEWVKRRRFAEERGHDGRVIDPVNVEALPKDLISEAIQGDAARHGLAHCNSTVNLVKVEASPQDLMSEAIQGNVGKHDCAITVNPVEVEAASQGLMSEASRSNGVKHAFPHCASIDNPVKVEAASQGLMSEAGRCNGVKHAFPRTDNPVKVEALPKDLISEAIQGDAARHGPALCPSTVNQVKVEASPQGLISEAIQGNLGKPETAITVNPVKVEAASQDSMSEVIRSNDVKHAFSHSATNPVNVEPSPNHMLPKTVQGNAGEKPGLAQCTRTVNVKHGSLGGDVET